MKTSFWLLVTALLWAPCAATAANPGFVGRWRLDLKRSTALDGWSTWDVVIGLDGTRVSLRNDMTWRTTKVAATNVVDTASSSTVQDFFRVEQRHMALYSVPSSSTPVRAEWLDGERTLRVEATVPIESSQGTTPMRIYQELRLIEGGRELQLIELHNTRQQPLVYRFTKVSEEK